MTSLQPRAAAESSQARSVLGDMALFASLAGVVVILIVSMIERRELRRLNARVTQLEAFAKIRAQGISPEFASELDITDAPTRGPERGVITIAEFAEFQCPFCVSASATLKQLESTYKGKIRFVWKHLPLTSIHMHAMDASIAAEAARRQGKFWEYHDKLFANQQKLGSDMLIRWGQDVGLDMEQFERDRNDPETKRRIEADMKEASALAVTSTPTFFINGRRVVGAMPLETFTSIIDEELSKENSHRPSSVSSQH
jgi:protein-disulfide isomerase